MTELNSINTYIQEHTGFASNFKTGIVWDNNPEFDGKVKITVIATGFKMERLSDITDITLGNIIEITEDFVHNSILIKKGEIDLGNDIETIRIGPSSHIGSRTFYYNEDSMPILATVDKTNIAELENIPAIKRNNKGEF